MATPLIITYFGPPEHKHPVKVMPMAPLRPAFEEACKRFKLDPAAHALALPAGPARRAPQPVELDVPFRLLPNVPSGARLEVVAVEAKAPAAPAAAAAARPAAAPAPAPAPVAAEAAAAPAPAPAPGPSTSSEPAPAPAPAAEPAAAQAAPSGPLASLGVRQQVHVFHRRALEAQAEAAAAAAKAKQEQEQQEAAAAPSPSAAPPTTTKPATADSDDDDFYEFTAEDWALAQRAAERRRREEEKPLTTQAQRDAAAKRRAESYGPVPVRLHYPDGSIVQAEFSATDTLFSVWELAARLASAELAGVGGEGGNATTTTTTTKKTKDDDSLPLYLYTAPPKVVVKDLSVTLYQVGFVPAANLHVGSSAPSATRTPQPPSLRAEARALASDEVPPVRLQRPRRDGDGEDGGGRGGGKGKAPVAALLGGAGRGGAMGLLREQQQGGGGAGGGGGGGGAKPKWLQMGRK